MGEMMRLLREVFPLRMAPVSEGLDRCVEILCRELPFTVHEYEAGSEHNGWVLPMKWEVRRAAIRRDGEMVWDGMAHPLRVIGYSRPFHGRVPLAELKDHLFHHPVLADALVYHCDMYYKPWRQDWGFSMPKQAIDALPEGDYDVELETTFEAGTTKVLELHVPGASDETVVLNAHNCHAAQANDDISGVVVGVEAMRRLTARDNRLSYRLVVAPEHLGTVFHVAAMAPKDLARMRFGIFLEMLGHDSRLAVQRTFNGDTLLDRAAEHVLRFADEKYDAVPFRRLIGNDETVWEAPGVEVPTISLSRWPNYPYYHSDQDTDERLDERRLEEAVDVVLQIVDVLEDDRIMHRNFDGLIALSNPRFDLYLSNYDPSIRPTISARQREWNYLMDCLPRFFDGETTVLDVAERHELPFHEVLEYVLRFEEKGLIQTAPANRLRS
jgi:aminopeptidase-like protein